MQFNSFKILNYKCFRETAIELGPGFNIITGQNNAGKTALLEALSLRFHPRPHRSRMTAPTQTSQVDLISSVTVKVTLDRAEMLEGFLKPGNGLNIPAPTPRFSDGNISEPAVANQFLERLFNRDTFIFNGRLNGGPGGTVAWETSQLPSLDCYEAIGGTFLQTQVNQQQVP